MITILYIASWKCWKLSCFLNIKKSCEHDYARGANFLLLSIRPVVQLVPIWARMSTGQVVHQVPLFHHGSREVPRLRNQVFTLIIEKWTGRNIECVKGTAFSQTIQTFSRKSLCPSMDHNEFSSLFYWKMSQCVWFGTACDKNDSILIWSWKNGSELISQETVHFRRSSMYFLSLVSNWTHCGNDPI